MTVGGRTSGEMPKMLFLFPATRWQYNLELAVGGGGGGDMAAIYVDFWQLMGDGEIFRR